MSGARVVFTRRGFLSAAAVAAGAGAFWLARRGGGHAPEAGSGARRVRALRRYRWRELVVPPSQIGASEQHLAG